MLLLRLFAMFALLIVQLTGGNYAMGAEEVKLENLKQPPLNTTLMGVLKGTSDFYKLNLSEPMIYGLSGHAFLINIHTEICPSGPYVWKRENINPLIANMGLKMTDLGFYSPKSEKEDKDQLEKKLQGLLNRGIPCSMVNLDNQIIYGYDDSKLLCAQPWAPKTKFPPATLTFETWKELGEQYHVTFYSIEKASAIDRKTAIIASLTFAVDLHDNPSNHTSENYGVGPNAYDNWIKAVPDNGTKHGNWWNGTVWSECRGMAARYFSEIGKEYPSTSNLCSALSADYTKISDNLKAASNKKMDSKEKIELLKKTKALETKTIGKIKQLITFLNTPE